MDPQRNTIVGLMLIAWTVSCTEQDPKSPASTGGTGGGDGASTGTTSGPAVEYCDGGQHLCQLTAEPVLCQLPAKTVCYDLANLIESYNNSASPGLAIPQRRCYGPTPPFSSDFLFVAQTEPETGPLACGNGVIAPQSCHLDCESLTAEELGLPPVLMLPGPLDPSDPPGPTSWELQYVVCKDQAATDLAPDYAGQFCGGAVGNEWIGEQCSGELCASGDDGLDDTGAGDSTSGGDSCDPDIVEWALQGECVWYYTDPVTGAESLGDATAQLPSAPPDGFARRMCVGPDFTLHSGVWYHQVTECSPDLESSSDLPAAFIEELVDQAEADLLGQDFRKVEDWDHDLNSTTADWVGSAWCRQVGSAVPPLFSGLNGTCGCVDGSCNEDDDAAVNTEDPCDTDSCADVEALCIGAPATNGLGYRDNGASYSRSGTTFYGHLDLDWLHDFAAYNPALLWVCNAGRYVFSHGTHGEMADLDSDSVFYDLGFRNGDTIQYVWETTGAPLYTRVGDVIFMEEQEDVAEVLDSLVPASGPFDLAAAVTTNLGTSKTIHFAVD